MSPRSSYLAIVVTLVACQTQPAAEGARDPPGRPLPVKADAAVVTTPTAPAPVTPPVIAPIPAPAPAIAALPGDALAYVTDDTGLVEVGTTAGVSQVIAAPGVSWCGVDARGQVVWFVSEGGLQAFDLVDRRIHTIIAENLAQIEIIIDWGREKLGGEDALEFDVGAAIGMTSAPTIKTVMGCDGDRAVYCFEDDGTTPTAAVVKAQQQAAALRLVDAPYIASLAARGATGSLWAPPPMPPGLPSGKPVVPRKRCTEQPEDCGSLIAIPESPLWLVVTGNSRGDYDHEDRQLWDPRTGEFIAHRGGKIVRSKKPATEPTGDYAGLRVLNGTFTHDGVVFDESRVVFVPKDINVAPTSCGFARGGWRIPGPTG